MKTKELKDLTIKEFDLFKELHEEEVLDKYELFKLFGYDLESMDIPEMQRVMNKISSMTFDEPKGIRFVYKVNGRRFNLSKNITKIKASQFIDLQTYMKSGKLQNILSVFLIPQYRTWYGVWKTYDYNTGYDIFEVQDFLYENFNVGDANELSAFFLTQSQNLLKVMTTYLEKKEMKMRYKQLMKSKGK